LPSRNATCVPLRVGTALARSRAKDYVNFVLTQRTGPVFIDTEEKRDDMSVINVPEVRQRQHHFWGGESSSTHNNHYNHHYNHCHHHYHNNNYNDHNDNVNVDAHNVHAHHVSAAVAAAS
jgi:hypothetical protein